MALSNLMPTETLPDEDNSSALRRAAIIRQDEDFFAAVKDAHPEIPIGVCRDPGTDNPQPVSPPVTLRSAHGFDYQGED